MRGEVGLMGWFNDMVRERFRRGRGAVDVSMTDGVTRDDTEASTALGRIANSMPDRLVSFDKAVSEVVTGVEL